MQLTAHNNNNEEQVVPELGIPPVANTDDEAEDIKIEFADEPSDEATSARDKSAPGSTGESLPRHRTKSIIAAVLALLAWVALPFSEVATLAFGIVALLSSIVALRQGRNIWRLLALVSLLAAAVLLLVLIIFWGGILYVLGTL